MTAVSTYTDFDVCGPLPSGVTVLEASAGTGKTYTIAALTARYVAEGTPLDRLLLITFTRMATGELRDRVRERLVGCEQALSAILAGAPDTYADPVVTLLATGDPGELTERRDRLARAVADFDAATIATTHGFCQEVLAELGTVGDLDRETGFVEDVSELLEQALDDLYVRRFHRRETARFKRAEALKIARAAVDNPMAELEPRDEPTDSTAAMRYRLAVAVRKELEQRKRRLAIMTYDDLLTRLNSTLGGPSGPAARDRLSSRFDVVLVDEFQDTDPIQWQILDRAFAAGGVTLVLVADPKQAIYAFRGADVYAYLTAAATARARATLRENRRADQSLIDAYDALFAGAKLGHEGIVYRQVRATPAHQEPRLVGAPGDAALRVRVVLRNEPDIELTYNGFAATDSARDHIARDLAADVVGLLSSGARIEHRTPNGEPTGDEPICPRHIAVLVRTHATAELVRDELVAANVPVVINGAGSVFATRSARDWLALLEAIERPASPVRARTAALTHFLGWSAERIAIAPEEEWEEVHRRLHRWSRILRDRGVAALLEEITVGEDLAARVLCCADGERRLTDLRHLAQLLHRAASTERLGVTALRGWLAERVADADRDEGEEERARRLESDAEAVQVLTIHRSKGLEFPVVYCPFLWDPTWIRSKEPVAFHDPATGYRHTVDVGLEGRTFKRHSDQYVIEQRGEDLRLAYVALTRAKHRAVIWWAGTRYSCNSPLARLLFAKDADGVVRAFGDSTPGDATVVERFRELAATAPGRISVERSTLAAVPAAWSPALEPPVDLAAARLHRRLDPWWRRTSYSDITAEAHDPLVGSEPERPVLSDEPETPTPVAVAVAGAVGSVARPELERESPLGAAPVGVDFGTFVHTVLEATDFAAPDLDAELAEHVTGALSRRAFDLGEPGRVVQGLRAAIETPLGPIAGGVRLRDVARADRLDELEFELPLAGGDAPTGRLTLQAIAGVLREHLPAGDPMAAYAARLEDPALRSQVRGFLTGSIDLVIRLDGERFAIVDYKTNWLGPAGEPLTLVHYQPEALAAEMSRAHYGLQALLYTVALHRYLRWRLPGYDPDRQLAGVLYLFLRGMAGEVAGGSAGWAPIRRVRVATAGLARAVAERRARREHEMSAVADPFEARRAVGATGLLRAFNEIGVLSAADVHVAARLAELVGEESESVRLAVALAVRGPRLGHVFVDLATIRDTASVESDEPVDLSELPWPGVEGWLGALAGSELVALGELDAAPGNAGPGDAGHAGPGDAGLGDARPLRLLGTRLYLDRYWREERAVAADLNDLTAGGRLQVIAGGPGTGKTTEVARMVAELLEGDGRPPLIALAAPTGKAAARLQEAVHEEAAALAVGEEVRDRMLALRSSTLHRLLGWRPRSHSRFAHDRGNRLPHDVVIVDETSMVSLSLMARLVESVRTDARLVLVGDPGQLASIEAGVVLADIVAVGRGVVVLERVYRYGGGIARLAGAIRDGDADAAVAALGAAPGEITWIQTDVHESETGLELVRDRTVGAGLEVASAARGGAALEALGALGRFRLLCAHRRGPYGVSDWTSRIQGWLAGDIEDIEQRDFVGRPLLVTENDYELGLYNGDTGVIVEGAGERPAAAFERGGEVLRFSPLRLGAVDTAYAMTIHKSQGSQFDTAAVLLPAVGSRILTRELLYTAVTRARRELILVGTEDAVRQAVARPVARASGLRERLRGYAQ